MGLLYFHTQGLSDLFIDQNRDPAATQGVAGTGPNPETSQPNVNLFWAGPWLLSASSTPVLTVLAASISYQKIVTEDSIASHDVLALIPILATGESAAFIAWARGRFDLLYSGASGFCWWTVRQVELMRVQKIASHPYTFCSG